MDLDRRTMIAGAAALVAAGPAAAGKPAAAGWYDRAIVIDALGGLSDPYSPDDQLRLGDRAWSEMTATGVTLLRDTVFPVGNVADPWGDYQKDIAAKHNMLNANPDRLVLVRSAADILKAKREKILPRLKHLGAVETPWSPLGLRIELGAGARNPGVNAEEDFIKGAIEVQDEGSQLAALFSAAKPGEQVIDLCAGAGGKTLAIAAMMGGKGRLIATDHDKRQLAPIHERLSRAGVHNADVRTPKGDADPLADIRASADLVLIDAPCTGTGTWRRNPDAKWRMRPGALEVRLKDQIEVLDRAAPLVKPRGRIAYITCSVLPAENGDQVRAFLGRHPEFSIVPPEQTASVLWDKAEDFARAALQTPEGWLMTPGRTGTDGFFVSVLKKT